SGSGGPGSPGRAPAWDDQAGGADAAAAGRHRMSEPVQVGELLPGVVAEAIARAGAGYGRWMEHVAATGYCAHPVRLRGTVEHADQATGEVRTVYDTEREPDATLLKACGNRRAPVCPPSSATYHAHSLHPLWAAA